MSERTSIVKVFITLLTIILFQVCYSTHSFAAESNKPLIVKNNDTPYMLGKYISVYKSLNNSETISDILNENKFVKSENEVPNLGISPYSFWLKFSIKNESGQDTLLLSIEQPYLDSIEFYSPEKGTYKVFKTGDNYTFSKRQFKNHNFIFKLPVKNNQLQTYFLKIKTGEQLLLPMKVGTSKSIFEENHTKDIIFGIYCGIIFVMFFYNLFLFFTVKDNIYLSYVIYILFIGLTQASILGYPNQYLWPESPYIANLSVYIFSCLVSLSALEFVRVFLLTKQYLPTIHNLSYLIIAAYLVTAILAILKIYNISYFLVLFNAAMVSAYMLIVGFLILRKGYKPAKFFLLGWSWMLVGIIIYVLKDFQILGNNIFTNYTMPAGSAMEVILLSFALADRINTLKQEKEISQAEAIRAMAENDRIIREQNIILESKVEERTSELQQSNQDLNKALTNLQEAQSQLVDAEKMASLGQLTAGIAHEINNPINFVSSSINPLKRDIQGLMQILEEYEKLHKQEPQNVNLKEIERLKEDLEYDYLKEEIDMMLSGIAEGATRTAEIVKSLRNFSRLDEDALKPSDLNQGIDSTLVLLNNSMDGKVKISKCYNDIPFIECFPGKINQVFMNILTNSIQAVKAKNIVDGEISISTFEKDEFIGVSIKDNGIGMSEKTKMKIFEPFFTTKDVGEGTGLGLSIVYTIIESHKGKIEVHSEEGIGTEFILYLPKNLQSLK
ncbi:MAG: GHKL domain-containing protein [Sporocytophaga sp.]|uniref:sensor histidine kinase n=1 Tax=Sporocytophaga sp. TaxID=2231183 RepID=UPI001B0B3EDC|nr:7TM diverse intracellular signaling domain-containing protein [Sporocytophaga sp.]MBO9699133.1 GHKL domain-containing protein [Sporocytophaga sp.]